MVTEEELKNLLESQGWTLGKIASGKQHIYSAKRYRKEGNITRYIGTQYKLKDMTSEQVISRLNRPAKTQDS